MTNKTANIRQKEIKQIVSHSVVSDVKNELIISSGIIANSNMYKEKRLKIFLSRAVTYLRYNKGIAMLRYPDDSHNNGSELKKRFKNLFNSLKKLVSKIFATE